MNTLKDKVIVYDDNCPLCAWYTGKFVQYHMLPANGRVGYTSADKAISSKIDTERYRTEIAVVDTRGGETLYGTDGLSLIIGNSFPLLRPLLQKQWFVRFIKKLYRFISYNRKIIAPHKSQANTPDCTPAFSRKHRVLFIVFSILVSCWLTWMCGRAFAMLVPGTSPASGGLQLLAGAGTGWALQFAAAALFLKGEKAFNYAGHLAVIMLVGLFILSPYALLASLLPAFGSLIALAGVMCSFSMMLYMHTTRVNILEIPQAFTWLWALNLMAGATAWAFYFYY